MKLIDKDKVVAEVERRLDKLYNLLPDASKVENGNITISESCNTGKYMALESFKNFLDTFETKEVDLENSMVCKVDWYDGFLLDYTQEQQDALLEKIGANVGDKVRVILIKE